MTITRTQNGPEMTVALAGRLDTTTAPELNKELSGCLDGVTLLTFDFSELEYISSAGLRVLLLAQKTIGAQGRIRVIHANDLVMDVFRVTGFADAIEI